MIQIILFLCVYASIFVAEVSQRSYEEEIQSVAEAKAFLQESERRSQESKKLLQKYEEQWESFGGAVPKTEAYKQAYEAILEGEAKVEKLRERLREITP